MASLDDLEAQPTATNEEPTVDPCAIFANKVCVRCEFCGQVDSKQTWRAPNGNMEPMRYCYQFNEFVPARHSFGCTLYSPIRS